MSISLLRVSHFNFFLVLCFRVFVCLFVVVVVVFCVLIKLQAEC